MNQLFYFELLEHRLVLDVVKKMNNISFPRASRTCKWLEAISESDKATGVAAHIDRVEIHDEFEMVKVVRTTHSLKQYVLEENALGRFLPLVNVISVKMPITPISLVQLIDQVKRFKMKATEVELLPALVQVEEKHALKYIEALGATALTIKSSSQVTMDLGKFKNLRRVKVDCLSLSLDTLRRVRAPLIEVTGRHDNIDLHRYLEMVIDGVEIDIKEVTFWHSFHYTDRHRIIEGLGFVNVPPAEGNPTDDIVYELFNDLNTIEIGIIFNRESFTIQYTNLIVQLFLD